MWLVSELDAGPNRNERKFNYLDIYNKIIRINNNNTVYITNNNNVVWPANEVNKGPPGCIYCSIPTLLLVCWLPRFRGAVVAHLLYTQRVQGSIPCETNLGHEQFFFFVLV